MRLRKRHKLTKETYMNYVTESVWTKHLPNGSLQQHTELLPDQTVVELIGGNI